MPQAVRFTPDSEEIRFTPDEPTQTVDQKVAKIKAGLASQSNLKPISATAAFPGELLNRAREVGKPFSQALDLINSPLAATDAAINSHIPATAKGLLTGPQEFMAGSSPDIPFSQYALMAAPNALSKALPKIGYDTGKLERMAAENKARAIAPTTLQGRSDIASVANEASRKGLAGGLRGSTIDRNILEDLQNNANRVGAAEARVTADPRPEMQVPKASLLGEIDAAKAKLNIPRTGITARPEAVSQLNDIHSMIDKLPDYIDADQLIELRRQLDQRAEEAGAYGMGGDRLREKISRGVGDMVRGKVNSLDPELASANHDYSVSRRLADTVQRRQLGKSGKIESGIPGSGGILDDVLATWAGEALGGPIGGATMEAVNLARQSRGFANVKSSLQQKLADFVRPKLPTPAGLLGTGATPLSAVPDESFVRGMNAQQPLQITAGEGIPITATVHRGPNGPFEMPPKTPLQLPQGRMLLPEEAGSPFITPLRESLLEKARRLSRSR